MSDLLSPISTTRTTISESHHERFSTTGGRQTASTSAIDSPSTVLEMLSSQPNADALLSCLGYLDNSSRMRNRRPSEGPDNSPGQKPAREAFNIHVPSPRAAQILYMLINDVVPHHWDGTLVSTASSTLPKGRSDVEGGRTRRLLFRILRCSAGVGAVLARIRLLIDRCKAEPANASARSRGGPQMNFKPRVTDGEAGNANRMRDVAVLPLRQMLELLNGVIGRDDFVVGLWKQVCGLQGVSESQRRMQWREAVGLVGGGRVIALVAEAEDSVNASSVEVEARGWMGERKGYSAWLGRNLARLLGIYGDPGGELDLKTVTQLLEKGLKLGYEGECILQVRDLKVFFCLISFIKMCSLRSALQRLCMDIARPSGFASLSFTCCLLLDRRLLSTRF